MGPPEVRWGNFKEVSAWGKVHGHGHAMVHGHGTRRSLRKRACIISSLLISLSDFFYKLVVDGQLSRHSGFVSRCLFHIVVHSFLCGLFAPALRWRSSPVSRLTSRGSRLTFDCSQPSARVGPARLRRPRRSCSSCSPSGRDASRAFGIVSLTCLQPPP